jgi:hypothetical protein
VISNPKKRAAHDAVRNAIRSGQLIPWPCCAVPECDRAPEAHHPDYDKPLSVVWLCPSHHKEVHAMVEEV